MDKERNSSLVKNLYWKITANSISWLHSLIVILMDLIKFCTKIKKKQNGYLTLKLIFVILKENT